MSLYPFPTRRERPPPVPPKSSPVQPVLDVDTPLPAAPRTKKLTLQRSMTSLSQRTISSQESSSTSPAKYPDSASVASAGTSDGGKSASVLSLGQSAGDIDLDALQRPTSPAPQLKRLEQARQRAKDVWQARRKGASATMTTVQEGCMDSPTIPAWPNLQQDHRKGAAAALGWRQCVFGETIASRIISPPPEKDISRLDLDESTPASQPASSAPPSLQPSAAATDAPPSPRVPLSSSPDRKSPHAPGLPPAPKITPTLKSAPIFRERVPASGGEDAAAAAAPPRRVRADSAPHPADRPATPEKAAAAAPTPARQHRRKKSSISSSGSSSVSAAGVRPAEARARMGAADLAALQARAKASAARFEVLAAADADAVGRELAQLELRCTYLRETRRSLRKGRRALHARLLLYLRSASAGSFSQENLLRQEEALAELDAAIDEWEGKLERADERRMMLRQKLLEHAAATLSIAESTVAPRADTADTPPATPERAREKYDRESITVYALLADVKQEIERTTPIKETETVPPPADPGVGATRNGR